MHDCHGASCARTGWDAPPATTAMVMAKAARTLGDYAEGGWSVSGTQSRFSSASELMRNVLLLLEGGVSGAGASEAEGAMEWMPDLGRLLREAPPADGELREFRDRLTDLLGREPNLTGLRRYLHQCSLYAQRGRLDGFESACWMRTGLEVLKEECVAWERPSSAGIREELEELEEIDEMIERVSDEAPPIPEEDIPGWVPESHWWWRAPEQQGMSQEERERRLYYEAYDVLDEWAEKH